MMRGMERSPDAQHPSRMRLLADGEELAAGRDAEGLCGRAVRSG